MSRRPGDVPAGRALVLLFRTAWKASRWMALAAAGSELIVATAQVTALYGMKVIVDGAAERSLARAMVGALVVAVSMAARQMCSWADTLTDLRERTAMHLEAQVVDLSARLPGIEHHERPELLDQLQLVREQRSKLGDVIPAVTSNLAGWTATTASIVLLASLHPVLLLVGLGGLIGFAAARRTERLTSEASERVATEYRLTRRLEELARDPQAAGELRLHRVQDLVLDRHRTAGERVIAVEQPAQLRATALDLAGGLVFVGSQVATIAFAAHLGSEGRLSLGDVVLAVGLIRRTASQLNGVIDGFGYLLQTLRAVRRLAWLQDEAAAADARHRPPDAVDPPRRLTQGIRLDRVSFAYPGTEAHALTDVDLVLPAGTTTAIVGENGAGKSTLVKLLLRMYEPTEGRILVDDIDLHDLDVDQWRLRASGAFQDPLRPELVLQEVVGIGDLPSIEDGDAVSAAVGLAGAQDIVRDLPAGLATPLGPSFANGVQMSGGQWQLLALARAMMRDRPILLVLDEPTAALDAGREHQLFERYAAAARVAATETGGITVIVSHRFSTVRMADHIVVLDKGQLRESGTHAELMSRGGLYAELYTLQAKAYA